MFVINKRLRTRNTSQNNSRFSLGIKVSSLHPTYFSTSIKSRGSSFCFLLFPCAQNNAHNSVVNEEIPRINQK